MTRKTIMQAPAPYSPKTYAHWAGFFYLIVIVCGIFAQMGVRDVVVVGGDAVATARNLMANQQLYRLGLVAEIAEYLCSIPIMFIFYHLFSRVNPRVTLVVVFFCMVGTAVESACLVLNYAPLALLSAKPFLQGVPQETLQALAYLSIQLYERGFSIALMFFGCFCLCFGHLVYRSRFLPRFIGVMLAIEGVAYLVNSLAVFAAPALAPMLFKFLMVAALAEITLCLWLLIRGLNESAWNAWEPVAK
jgi:hypothetical protein